MKKIGWIKKSLIILTIFGFAQTVFAQSFNGKTQWSNPIEINSIVSSSVEQIYVKVGQTIAQGDDLLLMDKALLLIDFKLAESNLAVLEPVKLLAEMDMNRAFELYDRELMADVALKTAESQYAKIKADFDAAQAVKDKAEYLLNSMLIKSPINGRVISINRSVGFFSDNEHSLSLMTIVDDSKMDALAYVKVSQWDIALVGKKASVIINKKSYKGIVKSLAFVPIKNSKGLSVYPIIISFKSNEALPSGMPLSVEIK